PGGGDAWAREKGFPFLEAAAAERGASLCPLLGRFEEGRKLLAKSKSIYAELGARDALAWVCRQGARLELLAGDVQAAERELRDSLRIREEMGATRSSALIRLQLANVALARGRDAEAEQLLEQAQAEGAIENIRFQQVWRMMRAKLLAGRRTRPHASPGQP